MSYYLSQFGMKVKDYRLIRGYSQEQLAEEVGVAPNTISLWETGKSFIEYPTLVKLCKALGIEEAELLSVPTQKGDSYLDQINYFSAKLPPVKQKQILEIIKTFPQ